MARITLPHKIAKNFEKNKIKKLEKKLEKRRLKGSPTGPLLISCKRKAYNFYMGQKFDGLNVASMVSCGWKNKKRVGDHFTLMPYLEVRLCMVVILVADSSTSDATSICLMVVLMFISKPYF